HGRVELFNGKGGVVEGCIQRIDRTGLDFVALENPKLVLPQNTQWQVFAAFGTLKGGRADWLVEKCTLSFLATAEAAPLVSTITSLRNKPSGLIIVGPEGDFTEEELNKLIKAGVVSVGLGPLRLRVETATIALLSTLMLWSDSHQLNNS
ncbi:Ribosomal RNA small subunit methyltransferase E, partial [Linum grandiflorum]